MDKWSRVCAPSGAPFRAVSSGLAREAEKPSLGPNLLGTGCRVDLSVSYSKQTMATHSTRHKMRGLRKLVAGRKTSCPRNSGDDLRVLFFVAGAAGDFQHREERFLG